MMRLYRQEILYGNHISLTFHILGNTKIIFGLPGINFSSSIEENLDDVYITPRCSKAERSVVRNIAVFLIGSPKQQ